MLLHGRPRGGLQRDAGRVVAKTAVAGVIWHDMANQTDFASPSTSALEWQARSAHFVYHGYLWVARTGFSQTSKGHSEAPRPLHGTGIKHVGGSLVIRAAYRICAWLPVWDGGEHPHRDRAR